jgi:hypothetical protein
MPTVFAQTTGASSRIGAIYAEHPARVDRTSLWCAQCRSSEGWPTRSPGKPAVRVEVIAADLGKGRSAGPPSSQLRQTKSFGMTVQIGAVPERSQAEAPAG